MRYKRRKHNLISMLSILNVLKNHFLHENLMIKLLDSMPSTLFWVLYFIVVKCACFCFHFWNWGCFNHIYECANKRGLLITFGSISSRYTHCIQKNYLREFQIQLKKFIFIVISIVTMFKNCFNTMHFSTRKTLI